MRDKYLTYKLAHNYYWDDIDTEIMWLSKGIYVALNRGLHTYKLA